MKSVCRVKIVGQSTVARMKHRPKPGWTLCPPMAHTPAKNAGERNFYGVEGIGQKQNAFGLSTPCRTLSNIRPI